MKAQLSRDNPGWEGFGAPQLRDFLYQRLSLEIHALRSGKLKVAKNLALATSADLWNLFFRKSSEARAECPCCGWTGAAFLAAWNWRAATFQSRCPNCDSRSRHRGLLRILENIVAVKQQGPILCFAPEGVVLQQIARVNPHCEVVTADLKSVDVDFPGEDIQHLSFNDASYSVVVCNHVLEHVVEDGKAIAECARVLRPGGIAVFTVPGDFDKTLTREFRKRDDNGHHRHYGLDFVHKLEAHFTRVESVDMSQTAKDRWHVRSLDYAFVCFK